MCGGTFRPQFNRLSLRRTPLRLALLLAGAAVVVAARGGSDEETPSVDRQAPTAPRAERRPNSVNTPGAAPAAGTAVLASGRLALPAAQAFGEPGFHEVLTAEALLPADVVVPAGSRLVLSRAARRSTGRTSRGGRAECSRSG